MASLSITDHQGNQSTVELVRGRCYRIGRSADNDIVLHDLGLSRKHAEIYTESDAWVLNDCDSSNGTFADGRRLTAPVRLEPRIKIRLGNCVLGLVADPADAETASPMVQGVRFSDSPMTSEGTVMLSVDEVMGKISAPSTRDTRPNDNPAEIQRRLNIVQRATLELLAYEPVDALLPKILDLVIEAVGPDRAALLSGDGEGELVCRAVRGRESSDFSISRTIADTVIKKRVSVLAADAQSDERFAEAQSVALQGIRAVMAAPLFSKEGVSGLIYTDSRLRSATFTEENLKLLTMLGNIAAIQIQNAHLFEEQIEKRRFEREAHAAAEIQRRLLPGSSPSIPGYSLVGSNEPCYEVGGDYYDCLTLDDQRHGLLIADVAGKGMGAALLMASLQATYHARADIAPSPKDLVDQLNRAISRSAPSNRFVTMFFMELDHTTHRARYVNAGHAPPPLLISRSGEPRELLPGGPPLGVFADIDYPVVDIELSPGDFLFACSDGVTDVMNPEGEMFGEEQLRELLVPLAGRSASAIHDTVSERLRAFAKGTPQPDDLTVVVLRRDD